MRNDVLLDDTGDLLEDGDEWAEGDSDETDVALIFLSELGTNREFPFAGFRAYSRLKSRTNKQELERDLTICLENDGFESPQIDFTDGITKPLIIV